MLEGIRISLNVLSKYIINGSDFIGQNNHRGIIALLGCNNMFIDLNIQ